MPASAKRVSLQNLGLQPRILMATLLPLVLISAVILCATVYQMKQQAEENLEERRASLIEDRRDALRDLIDTAVSSIAPLRDSDNANTQELKAEAADLLRSIRYGNNGYVFVYDYDGNNVVLPFSPDKQGTDMSDLTAPNGDYLVREFVARARDGGGFYEYPWLNPESGDEEAKLSYIAAIDECQWAVGTGVYIADIDAEIAAMREDLNAAIWRNALVTVGLGVIAFVIVALLAVIMTRSIVGPIRRTSQAMSDIASGEADLTRRLPVERHDEVGELAERFNAFVERIQHTLVKVRGASHAVDSASGEITQVSQDLSSRTEQTAANLQQTSASMEELTGTVSHSADSAGQANQLAQDSAGVARRGGEVMSEVEQTMVDIDTASRQVGEIITLMDSIAFQTNILALNASVEAARAGEHGRGFAVVASEVRTLASRSAEAAKEIRTLIETSTQRTQRGTELVKSAGATMHEIVESVMRVSDVINEISAASKEQSDGINQVNTAVAELDRMTQQNASMVEETSTASEELSAQAQSLAHALAAFQLGDDERASLTPPRQASRPVAGKDASSAQAPVTTRQTQSQDEWAEF